MSQSHLGKLRMRIAWLILDRKLYGWGWGKGGVYIFNLPTVPPSQNVC